jgi:type II secretory pathway pseudopilin PulG
VSYVLGNRDHTELRHALMYTVFDRYAGRSDHDWSAEFLKLYTGLQNEADQERAKKDARRVSGTAASLPVRKFAGDYSDPLHGEVKITDEAGGWGFATAPRSSGRSSTGTSTRSARRGRRCGVLRSW